MAWGLSRKVILLDLSQTDVRRHQFLMGNIILLLPFPNFFQVLQRMSICVLKLSLESVTSTGDLIFFSSSLLRQEKSLVAPAMLKVLVFEQPNPAASDPAPAHAVGWVRGTQGSSSPLCWV